jgi:hypothetical protein
MLARVTSGAYHQLGFFPDGTDGQEVVYRVTTRGRQDVPEMVEVIRKAVERYEAEPTLQIGHIPDEVDCMRIRYGLQHGLSAAFQIPLESVQFALKRDPIAGGVPVTCHAQVTQEVRDRMFDFVRGYCVAYSQRLT